MRLADLEPQLVRMISQGHYEDVADLSEAQGIMFLCPRCYSRNGGAEGTHSVLAWFRDRGVPSDESPGPGRWVVLEGSGVDDLTLSPSINLENSRGLGCEWHGNVTGGEVT
jgi:hypothetical protein